MHKLYLALCIITLFVFSHSSYADGCFIGKTANQSALTRDADVTEPNQNAFIAHYKGVEHLIIQVKYRGKLSEFLWLVPTPTKPVVERFENALFEELHEITAPPVNYWFSLDSKLHDLSFFMTASAAMGGMGHSVVNVIKQERIGIYDTVILTASKAQDLRDWLNDNGYPIPDTAVPIIADYLQRGWVFTAMRVNLQAVGSGWNGQEEGLLEPLHFTFASKEPIYPLKISSLNPGSSEILLYVAAENYVKSGMLKTEGTYSYFRPKAFVELDKAIIKEASERSGEMETREIIVDGKQVKVRVDSFGIYWHLTKLRSTCRSNEMTQDVTLEKSNQHVQPTPISAPLLDNIGLMGVYAFVAVQAYPYSMLVPVILALVYLRSSKAKQRIRLLAVVVTCGVWLYPPFMQTFAEVLAKVFNYRYISALIFRLPKPDDLNYIAYTDPIPVFFILLCISLLSLIVLTIFNVKAEKYKRHKALFIFGCVYTILASGFWFTGYSDMIVSCVEDTKSYAGFGILTIAIPLLVGLLVLLKARRGVTEKSLRKTGDVTSN